MSLPDDSGDARLVSPATGRPLTKRGEATRRRLLEAAEVVFADQGYHEASIVKITERAGIGLGTFYLYFDSKQSIFEALVIDTAQAIGGKPGSFSVGDAPSIADCCLLPQLASARRFGVDYAKHEVLVRIEAACMDLPAFKNAMPDQQPDAVRP